MRSRERRCGSSRRWPIRQAAGVTVLALALGLGGAVRTACGQSLEDYDYENLGLRAIGVDFVYADPSQSEGTIGFGARADLGFLGPYIRVVPRFAYWNAAVDGSQVAELERQIEDVSGLDSGTVSLGRIERDYWVLGMDLQWTLPEPVVAPYLGLGVDVYILNDSGSAIRNVPSSPARASRAELGKSSPARWRCSSSSCVSTRYSATVPATGVLR